MYLSQVLLFWDFYGLSAEEEAFAIANNPEFGEFEIHMQIAGLIYCLSIFSFKVFLVLLKRLLYCAVEVALAYFPCRLLLMAMHAFTDSPLPVKLLSEPA